MFSIFVLKTYGCVVTLDSKNRTTTLENVQRSKMEYNHKPPEFCWILSFKSATRDSHERLKTQMCHYFGNDTNLKWSSNSLLPLRDSPADCQTSYPYNRLITFTFTLAKLQKTEPDSKTTSTPTLTLCTITQNKTETETEKLKSKSPTRQPQLTDRECSSVLITPQFPSLALITTQTPHHTTSKPTNLTNQPPKKTHTQLSSPKKITW